MIYRGTASGSLTQLVANTGNVLMYVDTAVQGGQAYYYAIAAHNTEGEGAQSAEVSATPPSSGEVPPGIDPLVIWLGVAAAGAAAGIAVYFVKFKR